MSRLPLGAGLLLATSLFALPLEAQSLAERVRQAPDGSVRLRFAARAGVCGSLGGGIRTRDRDDDQWSSDCDAGPVHVLLTTSGGQVRRLRVRVGGHWTPAVGAVTDLGTVSAPEAAGWLVDLATADGGRNERVANDAILGATLADSVVIWPRLLQLAQRADLASGTRRAATFWLGQAAGDAATQGLVDLVDDAGDREVREAAVFAISQRPAAEGVPALLRLARTHKDPEVRRKAIFWLGQQDDPRVLAFFEEVLTRH